jgi:CHAD domain-containing protein
LHPNSLKYLANSLKKQWKRYRKELKCCQKKFSEESIHDSRVHARRLLSTIQLLSAIIPKASVGKIHELVKLHLDTFDDLRDTQVQMATVTKMRRSFPAAREFCDYLVKRENRFRKRTRKDIKHVKTRRLEDLIDSCRKCVESAEQKWPPERASAALLGSVDQAFARVRLLRSHVDRRDTRTIHCTRVAFKRFRYMVETMAPYLGHCDENFLKKLHHYQSMMGDIQDAQVLLRTFDKFLRKCDATSQAAFRFREELLRRRQWLIQVYLEGADQLLRFWPPPAPSKDSKPRTK